MEQPYIPETVHGYFRTEVTELLQKMYLLPIQKQNLYTVTEHWLKGHKTKAIRENNSKDYMRKHFSNLINKCTPKKSCILCLIIQNWDIYVVWPAMH